mmetsp:Transcript_103889/g.144561  ORF Transcript_103889/g.144561 Transcript_103889/m.144561 type:complete len:281 (+) Transcript_103889:289-1131(+)
MMASFKNVLRMAMLLAPVIVSAQDTTPCSSYDLNTGEGKCNGVEVKIGGVICAGGFNKEKCIAKMTNIQGDTETYYFKGTPTGLPEGPSLQRDCSIGDFPSGAGVAMAQTYQDANGNPKGCFPCADVQGSKLAYTAGFGGLQSVTVNFNVHTDSGGTQRDGFIKIACQSGGPTSNFQYTTVGDVGHQMQYEIHTTADCTRSGIEPSPPLPPGPPPPSGDIGYWCVANTTCLYGPRPNSSYKGGTQEQCKAICSPSYICKDNQCVVAERGGSFDECKAMCF